MDLATWMVVFFYGKYVGKCTNPMDPMGNNGIYGCFRKWWYPQIIHFNRVFHHKPSILGYHHFRKHPYKSLILICLPPTSQSSPALVTLATSTKVEPTGAFTDIRLAKGVFERKQMSSKGRERERVVKKGSVLEKSMNNYGFYGCCGCGCCFFVERKVIYMKMD